MNKIEIFRFNKEDNRWYVHLPEWEGDKADLEMVAGADLMLDALAYDNDWVDVKLSTEPFEDSKCLTYISDGYYANDGWHGPSTIWLCSVTEFVFGNYPPKIYYK